MSTKLTKVVANFETSLATKLGNGATSGSLTTAVDKDGNALPTGKYCMIADRGTGDEEHLLFDLSGVAMSNIFSVSRQGVLTAGVQNSNGHRAGSKCYLTDFVNLKVIVDILSGADTLDSANPIRYDADPTFTDSKQVVSKGYADAGSCGQSRHQRQQRLPRPKLLRPVADCSGRNDFKRAGDLGAAHDRGACRHSSRTRPCRRRNKSGWVSPVPSRQRERQDLRVQLRPERRPLHDLRRREEVDDRVDAERREDRKHYQINNL